MPHAPQTALVRLIQGITASRNILPGDRVPVRPQVLLLTDLDANTALDACGGKVAPGINALAACRDKALADRAVKAGLALIEPGCEVAALIEGALIVPGECAVAGLPVIHALGGIGALGLRVTPRDLGQLLAGGTIDITVPQVVRAELAGSRQPHVAGRDVFHLIRRELRVERLAGNALEISGTGLGTLRLFERIGLCSLACQAGLFAAFCQPDRTVVAELNAAIKRPYTTLEAEKGAAWAHNAAIDLSHAVVTATPPQGPDHARGITEFHGESAGQVVIGGDHSCGIEVVRHAWHALKENRLHAGLVCDLIPDSAATLAQAHQEDMVETLTDLGVTIHPPGTPSDSVLRPGGKSVQTTIAAAPGAWRVGPFAAVTVACAGTLAHPERLHEQPQRDSKLSGRRARPQ